MNTWSESTDSYIYNYITHLIINFFLRIIYFLNLFHKKY